MRPESAKGEKKKGRPIDITVKIKIPASRMMSMAPTPTHQEAPERLSPGSVHEYGSVLWYGFGEASTPCLRRL